MTREAFAGLLALALQGSTSRSPTAQPIPVAVYPVLDHRADPPTAHLLTQALAVAFRRDTGFRVIDLEPAARSRARRAQYGVVADLHPTAGRSVRLLVRVVDIESVYLVAFDSATGSQAEIERALPALAGQVGRRLRTLRAPPFATGRPPSWQIPTDALQAYARALSLGDRGDTAGAVRFLREALRIFPRYGEACEALRRLRIPRSGETIAGECR